MIKSIIILVAVMLVIHSPLTSQNIDSTYKYLAQYSILKFALSEHMSDGSNPTLKLLPSALEQVRAIVNTNNFHYKVELIDTLGKYEFIKITDSTNFRLHFLFQTVWAINKNNSILGNCIYLPDLGFESFVNQYLYENIDKYDKLDIVRLYFKIELIDSNIEIFDLTKNLDSFSLIEKEFRLSKKNRYNKIIQDKSYSGTKIYYYETFYRENSYNAVSYYHIKFLFDCNSFKVYKTLLYKIKV